MTNERDRKKGGRVTRLNCDGRSQNMTRNPEMARRAILGQSPLSSPLSESPVFYNRAVRDLT